MTAYPYYQQQYYPQNFNQGYQQQQAYMGQNNGGYATQQNVQQAPQVNAQNQSQQIQNSGFLPAPNEEYVKTFPIGAGNCITFKIEGKPIVMEKSMGFSQLEAPKIDRYRLVKEEAPETPQERQNDVEKVEAKDSINALERQIDVLSDRINVLEKEINSLKETPAPKKTTISKKKEVIEDDAD